MMHIEQLESRVAPATFVCQAFGPDFDVDIRADVQIDEASRVVATDISFTGTQFETEAKEVILHQRLAALDTVFTDLAEVPDADLDSFEIHVTADMIDGVLSGRANQFLPGVGTSDTSVEVDTWSTSWGRTSHAVEASVEQGRGNQTFIGPIDIREFNPDGSFIGPINIDQL